MSKYALFLDDKRSPESVYRYTAHAAYIEHDWVVVRSYESFVAAIDQLGIPYIVSFDHDIGKLSYIKGKKSFEKTGIDCSRYLKEKCDERGVEYPIILVHSMNPVGADNIRNFWK